MIYKFGLVSPHPFFKENSHSNFLCTTGFLGCCCRFGFFFFFFYMNIFLAAVLCCRARWTLFGYDPSLWSLIQWDCSWVYTAAILLSAVCLLTTQHEAGRVKAVFKDFLRSHPHLLYLCEVFLFSCSPNL